MRKRLRRPAGVVSIALGLVVAFASAVSAQAVSSERLITEIDSVLDLSMHGMRAADHLGLDVASGDINGDGVDDLVVGAPLGDPGGLLNAGETYIFYGPLGPGTIDPADADVTIYGVDPKSQSGRNLAISDVNDDGAADLIVGALTTDPGDGRPGAGEIYIVFGPIGPGIVELSTEADIVIEGIAERDHSGSSVGGGDLNGDGMADLVIGGVDASPDLRTRSGDAFVVFGPLIAGTYRLEQIVDVTIQGIQISDQLGYGVAVGDVNHDGVQDLVMGAMGASPFLRIDAGMSFVVLGPLAAGRFELLLEADIIFEGAVSGDLSGGDIEVGDLDNDGVDDVIIGAQWADGLSQDSGQVAIFFGPRSNGTFNLTDADVTYNGINARDATGGGLALGDLDDDGREDLIIGAGLADGFEREDSGAVYVIFASSLPFSLPERGGSLSTIQVAGLAVAVFLVVTPAVYWWLRRRPLDA